MEYKFTSKDEMDTIELAQNFESEKFPNMIICLNGELGSGKTVFTKGIGKYLGIKRTINSPTFTIMKIYDTQNPIINKLYHLDVYRLDNSESDFELEEYFYLDGLTVIEWSIIIEDILPSDMWNVEITIENETTRVVKIIHNSLVLEEKIKEAKYEVIYR